MTLKEKLKLFLNDIRFWIILFFVIRLIGITNPPLELGHSWRQVTGLMVSRNFYEIDNNILYPRVDECHGRSGIIGMEFPLMNYVYYLISLVFGYTTWYGRLINLIVSSFGIYFFYRIIKEYFNEKIAHNATLILLSSIWFSYSRKMMPDTFCISLMMIGLFYGLRYLKNGGAFNLFYYSIFALLGIMSKIPAGIYFSVLIIPFVSSGISKNYTINSPISRGGSGVFKNFVVFIDANKYKLNILISTIIILVLTYAWYFIWNQYLAKTYGNWYNGGKDLISGTIEISNHLGATLEKFYFSAFSGFIFFICFLAGIVFAIKNKEKILSAILFCVSVIYFIYILKSGHFFYEQNYYIIPFVPVMALIAAYAITLFKKQWLIVIVLVAGMLEGIANQQHDLFIKKNELYKLKLEAIADSISAKNDLIVINGNSNSQQMYLSHRKGWVCDNMQLLDSLYLNNIISKDCRFIFVDKHTFNKTLKFKIIYDDADYRVYLTK